MGRDVKASIVSFPSDGSGATTYAATNADGVALKANASRRYAAISNVGAHPAYLNFGGPAQASCGVLLAAGALYEIAPERGNLTHQAIHAITGGTDTTTLALIEGT